MHLTGSIVADDHGRQRTMSLCVTSCMLATSSNLRSSCFSLAFSVSLKCLVNVWSSGKGMLAISTSVGTLPFQTFHFNDCFAGAQGHMSNSILHGN